MCFEGKGIIARRRRAKEDIYVFKVCKWVKSHNEAWPWFYMAEAEEPYKEGGVYTSKLERPTHYLFSGWGRKFEPKYRIGEGIHSYGHASCYTTMEEMSAVPTGDNRRQVEFNVFPLGQPSKNVWLHKTFAYVDETDLSLNIDDHSLYRIATVMGIIPKGAHYYKNDKGEYVSDKFIVTKVNVEKYEP